jgi:hypothetical protein
VEEVRFFSSEESICTLSKSDTGGEPHEWGTSLEKDAFFLTKWGSHLLFFARMRHRWGNISRKTGFATSIKSV